MRTYAGYKIEAAEVATMIVKNNKELRNFSWTRYWYATRCVGEKNVPVLVVDLVGSNEDKLWVVFDLLSLTTDIRKEDPKDCKHLPKPWKKAEFEGQYLYCRFNEKELFMAPVKQSENCKNKEEAMKLVDAYAFCSSSIFARDAFWSGYPTKLRKCEEGYCITLAPGADLKDDDCAYFLHVTNMCR